jgi:hypothetical protein
MARLTVDSTPSGASTYVDDERAGATPLSLDTLAPGAHDLRVEKPGHRPYRERVSLAPGAPRHVTVRLTPLPGRLRVLVLFENKGIWASLAVDGEAVGDLRTLTRELPAGSHRVTAKREGYEDEAATIVVEPGQTKEVQLHLRRRETSR